MVASNTETPMPELSETEEALVATANATATLTAEETLLAETQIALTTSNAEATSEAEQTATAAAVPTSTPTPTAAVGPPLNPTLGSIWVRSADEMAMVYVPAGAFTMGSDASEISETYRDEHLQHEVYLDGFWIDQTEVTNHQYAVCRVYGPCEAESMGPTAYKEEYPVVGATWRDADVYCEWVGGQLPTEAQWEYAARGDDGRLYPWGNEPPTCDLALFQGCDHSTLPVGSFSPLGDSWVGAQDMGGNVAEWVADWYEQHYYARSPEANPTGPEVGEFKVVRGGGWEHEARYVRADTRSFSRYGQTGRHASIGFRCSAQSP
jgi:formylglycine-generating enzyme required for sulfatase activity